MSAAQQSAQTTHTPRRPRFITPHTVDLTERPKPAKPRPRRSWAPEPPTASKIPCWRTRDQWLLTLQCVLATPEGEKARHDAGVARNTLLLIARHDAAAADHDTGRNVRTAHQTVADQIGCCTKTVQRARTLLITLGLAVEAVRGRYLTVAERIKISLTTGANQRRIASTRHLTVPRRLAGLVSHTPKPKRRRRKKNVHLPRRGSYRTPRTSQRGTKRASPGGEDSISWKILAGRIHQRMPWLLEPGQHIGHLIKILQNTDGIDPERLTATEVLSAIDQAHPNWPALGPHQTRKPLAYFAARLKRSTKHLQQAAAAHADRAAANTRTTTPACNHPACDGHGWHNHPPTPKHPMGSATRCPGRGRHPEA